MEQESGISYKKVISGVVLLLLLASLPFIYYLVTQTQIFKPKASTYDIDIVPKAGVSVIQENGVPVIQTTTPDEFKIKIISPLDSQIGADAGFSIVKPAYASHLSAGTEFCESNRPKKIGSDGSHVQLFSNQACSSIAGFNECITYNEKATCYNKTTGEISQLTGGGNINCKCDGNLVNEYYTDQKYNDSCGVNRCPGTKVRPQTPPQQPAQQPAAPTLPVPADAHPASKYYRYCSEPGWVADVVYSGSNGARLESCILLTSCKEFTLPNGMITADCVGVGTSATRSMGYRCKDNKVTEYSQRGLYRAVKEACAAGTVCQEDGENSDLPFVAKCVASSNTATTGSQPSQGVASTGSRGCYEETQVCDNNKGSQICRICDGGYNSTCQPCVISAVPAAPAAAPDSRVPVGATVPISRDSTAVSSTTVQPTSSTNTGGSVATTTTVDEFADHSLDGKRSAYTCAEGPQDAEKPAGQYSWMADCSRKCMYNDEKGSGDPAGCPKNTTDLYVNPATSNWCYGFKDGNRCMQLKWTGAPATRTQTLPAANTQTIASAPAAPRTSAAPAVPAQPAAPASTVPAPASVVPAPASPVQPNNTGRKTTHYRVTTDPSRFNDWDTYIPGGVKLPFGFPSAQPGTSKATVSLFVQFKDNQGTIFNARPYPIIIKYVASTTPPAQPQNSTAQCTKGKVCGGNDTPCGVNGVGKCDACNGGWCKGGACETCAPDIAVPATRVACDDPSQITDTICGGGVKTYDTCTDNKSQTGASLCKNGATTFKCVGSKNDYCQSPEYQCSACPNFAPALTNPAAAPATTTPTAPTTNTSTPGYEPE